MTEYYPFGPLTREDFNKLSGSFYDASQRERQRIATQRGIRSSEFIGASIKDMLANAARGTEELATQEENLRVFDEVIAEGGSFDVTREEFLALEPQTQAKAVRPYIRTSPAETLSTEDAPTVSRYVGHLALPRMIEREPDPDYWDNLVGS